MPAKNTATAATVPPRLAELLQCFPCPAWIETTAGKILARNTPAPRPRPATRRTKKDTLPRPPLPAMRVNIFYLPPVRGAKNLRLTAHFPAAQSARWQYGTIDALLAKLLQPRAPAAAAGTRLTPREREIFAKLSQGYSYKNISSDIGISHEAVRQHIVRLRRKLGAGHIPVLRQKKRKTPRTTVT